ncbi:hypothetical protein SOPP22_12090 [Shewanella sp. OPT22]|nr:hypothetical protein SOPP22_12090 [Shewanella sp. OPT22]
MNTFFTWLGQADLTNMQQDKNASISSIATKNDQHFDKIVILANTWDEQWHLYENWLKKRMAIASRPFDDIKIHRANILSPIDYSSIAKEAQKWFSKLAVESDTLSINLSSGTPAMTAVSIILGKAKSNTVFYQSAPNGNIFKDDIPFDFVAEYDASVARAVSAKATSIPNQCKAFDNIVAVSSEMKKIVATATKLAELDLPVLVLGETGTGKEVISNAIHAASSRASKSMKTVNCGALPENLVDSILFGHVKGAFTGALKDHKGLFEQADGGTLFLDEIGELIPDIQVKLLRALQQGEITRVGDDKTITVDVRIIAATHRNLVSMVESGDFREDLFYRLALGVIEIPALRHRIDDIEPLTNELAKEINENSKKHPSYKSKRISKKGINFIISQPWRGNVRELWNTLNRALLLSNKEEISEEDIQEALIQRNCQQQESDVQLVCDDVIDLDQITEKIQKKYIEAALKATGGVRGKTAEMLSLGNHQNLKNRMIKLKMLPDK